MPGVTVAYAGVHQIYQIALAAQEMGVLDQFFCSLLDAPGKWGSRLAQVVGRDRLANMRCPELDTKHVKEYPWPLLFHLLFKSKTARNSSARIEVSEQFDDWVALQLNGLDSKVFVSVETCAMYSFEVAQRRGMTTILDYTQVHPDFLTRILAEAADDLHLPPFPPFDTPKTAKRKQQECSMADQLLMLSEVQKRSFLEAGFSPEQLVSVPLWSDTTLFYPPPAPAVKDSPELRVLFVGALSIRKGIPYLLKAMRLCGSGVKLTLLGAIMPEIEFFLAEAEGTFTYVPPTTKAGVRQYYWQSDVLVLPSLADTFGWVAMEAMTCGLPIIVSENCGVPVPDENWRVPVMNAEAIAEKLLVLRDNRDYCSTLGQMAANFAQQFTPQRYRQQLQSLFTRLL